MPRTKYELPDRKSTEGAQPEGVRHILNLNPSRTHYHPHDVKPILISRTSVRGHPGTRRPRQLTLLLPPDRLGRRPKIRRISSPDLDESDYPARAALLRSANHQVDITMAAPEPPVQNLPPVQRQPPGGNRLPPDSQPLSSGEHETSLASRSRVRRSPHPRAESNRCTDVFPKRPALAGAHNRHRR